MVFFGSESKDKGNKCKINKGDLIFCTEEKERKKERKKERVNHMSNKRLITKILKKVLEQNFLKKQTI